VKEPEVVSESAEVIFPPILTVSKVEPMAIVSAAVLSVPMLIEFPEVPVPILMVFALLPVPKLTLPVVPESSVNAEEVVDLIVPAPAKVNPVAEVAIVSIEATPVKAPPVETFNPPVLMTWNVPLELPMTVLPEVVARFVAPVEVKAVNVPTAAVVAPIAVLLIPVDVVVK
jgi:hypothetical protein